MDAEWAQNAAPQDLRKHDVWALHHENEIMPGAADGANLSGGGADVTATKKGAAHWQAPQRGRPNGPAPESPIQNLTARGWWVGAK